MAARNNKQARSSHEPMNGGEMTDFVRFVERAKANGQLEELLELAQVHVSNEGQLPLLTEDDILGTSSSENDFDLVENAGRPRGAQPGGRRNHPAPSSSTSPTVIRPTTTPSLSTTTRLTRPTTRDRQDTRDEIIESAAQRSSEPPFQDQMVLPEGVESIEEWGCSLFVLQKYKPLKLSYKEILEQAWDDKEMMSYFARLMNTYGQDARAPKAGKASDVVAYMKATQYPANRRLSELKGQSVRIFKKDG